MIVNNPVITNINESLLHAHITHLAHSTIQHPLVSHTKLIRVLAKDPQDLMSTFFRPYKSPSCSPSKPRADSYQIRSHFTSKNQSNYQHKPTALLTSVNNRHHFRTILPPQNLSLKLIYTIQRTVLVHKIQFFQMIMLIP